MTTALTEAPVADQKLVRGLGLLDSTMLVAGSMIGSGIFIVSSIIARQVGSPGWLLVVWIVTGLLTLTAALSYGELAAMMPKAGGQYVYLREAFSPLWGFLYGWTLFLVIQTGTIAAVAVGFARYTGVLIPWVSESSYIIAPIRFGGYAWASARAWKYITFARGDVVNPRRNVPLSLALGTFLVIGLYLLSNIAYLATLPSNAIQNAPSDRVACETANVIFPGAGATIMAVAIMVSTFGCNNGLILAGARAYYAMAKDGLFFRRVGELNKSHVPAWALVFQGIWAGALVLPRTVKTDAAGSVTGYGNLYGNLLDYVISAALIFYVLTIIGIFLLRRKDPHAERPYKAFGYPVVPIF